MGRIRPFYCVLNILLFLWLIKPTLQNTRTKRQIQPELPRIQTQNGHLEFQSGTNHNITFRSSNGGFININGQNMAVITQTVNQNKLAIEQLRTAPTTSPALESRLSVVESRLDNLQPTGAVQTQFITIGHRIDLLHATIPSNTGPRLTQLEQSLNNLQPTGQVAILFNQLTNRITTLEGRTTSGAGQQSGANLRRRVNRLRQRVKRLSLLE